MLPRDFSAHFVGGLFTACCLAGSLCERLGFRQSFAYRPFGGADPCYMGLTRDNVNVHVSSFSGDGVAGGVVFLGVEDVDALHKELKAKGVVIDLEPTDQSWGNREMYVSDPDGNSLRFVHRGE
jgi:catechol 2,3-dioxygenase-like lactoylglutathione lyase family enzyme